MNQENFIKTSDIETRMKLLSLGFKELTSNESNVYTFLNCTSIQFSKDIDRTKIKYSNVLCL